MERYNKSKKKKKKKGTNTAAKGSLILERFAPVSLAFAAMALRGVCGVEVFALVLGRGGAAAPQLTGTQRKKVAPMKPNKMQREKRENKEMGKCEAQLLPCHGSPCKQTPVVSGREMSCKGWGGAGHRVRVLCQHMPSSSVVQCPCTVLVRHDQAPYVCTVAVHQVQAPRSSTVPEHHA